MMNPLSIPQRLEDRIGKPENENVLNGFFAQIMIDAKYLVLGEEAQHQLIEMRRRVEISSERLLDDEAHPWSLRSILGARRKSARGQIAHDRLEDAGRHREVEQPVLVLFRPCRLDLRETRADFLVFLGVGELDARVMQALT